MSTTNIGAALTLGCCVEPQLKKRVQHFLRLDGARVVDLEVADLGRGNRWGSGRRRDLRPPRGFGAEILQQVE